MGMPNLHLRPYKTALDGSYVRCTRCNKTAATVEKLEAQPCA